MCFFDWSFYHKVVGGDSFWRGWSLVFQYLLGPGQPFTFQAEKSPIFHRCGYPPKFQTDTKTRWWFQIFLFSSHLGKWSNLTNIFLGPYSYLPLREGWWKGWGLEHDGPSQYHSLLGHCRHPDGAILVYDCQPGTEAPSWTAISGRTAKGIMRRLAIRGFKASSVGQKTIYQIWDRKVVHSARMSASPTLANISLWRFSVHVIISSTGKNWALCVQLFLENTPKILLMLTVNHGETHHADIR